MVQRHSQLPTGLPCPKELLLCVLLVSPSRPLVLSAISALVLSLVCRELHALFWSVLGPVVAMESTILVGHSAVSEKKVMPEREFLVMRRRRRKDDGPEEQDMETLAASSLMRADASLVMSKGAHPTLCEVDPGEEQPNSNQIREKVATVC